MHLIAYLNVLKTRRACLGNLAALIGRYTCGLLAAQQYIQHMSSLVAAGRHRLPYYLERVRTKIRHKLKMRWPSAKLMLARARNATETLEVLLRKPNSTYYV